jgi:hypothetical protein
MKGLEPSTFCMAEEGFTHTAAFSHYEEVARQTDHAAIGKLLESGRS